MTDEANVQRFARPENSGFPMTGGGSWISRPVTINRDWLRLAPYRALQISNCQISCDVKSFDDAISAHFPSSYMPGARDVSDGMKSVSSASAGDGCSSSQHVESLTHPLTQVVLTSIRRQSHSLNCTRGARNRYVSCSSSSSSFTGAGRAGSEYCNL